MAAEESLSWADQWGAGGIGAISEENPSTADKQNEKKSKTTAAGKAKAAAQKIRNGMSKGFNWFKPSKSPTTTPNDPPPAN